MTDFIKDARNQINNAALPFDSILNHCYQKDKFLLEETYF